MEWKVIAGEERLKGTLVFLGRFLVLAIPLYWVMLFANLMPFQVLVAGHSQAILELAGFGVVREGALMETGGFSFFISPDSTGWKSMMFLAALVVAVPGVAWSSRLAGLAIGIPLVYLGNLGRVVAIVFAEQAWGVEAAMFMHDILWRFGLIGIVLAIWGIWLWISRRSHGN